MNKIKNYALVALVIIAIVFFNSYLSLSKKNSSLTVQLAEAVTTLEYYKNESTRINKLNEANSRKIQALINKSNLEKEQLRNELQKAPCATVIIPSAANKRLRSAASQNNQNIGAD